MIIVLGGEKGGIGKTTVAVNLSVMRARMKRDVLLFDTDIQASASAWSSIRDELQHQPRIACVQKFGRQVAREILDQASRFDDVIVDTGGRESVELRAAMVVADMVWLPIQPSQFDIWTLGKLDTVVGEALAVNQRLKAYVFLNRASPNPNVGEAREADELLRELSNITPTGLIIRDRIAFRKSAKTGLAVCELRTLDMDAKAMGEVTLLYRVVFGEDFDDWKQNAPATASATA